METLEIDKIQDRFAAFVDDNGDDKGYRLTAGLSTNQFLKDNIQNENADILNSSPETKNIKKLRKTTNF